MNRLSRYILLIWVIVISYLFYVRFVLSPGEFNNFSFIDDGQHYQNSRLLSDCIRFKECSRFINEVFIEKQFNRFRPFSWLAQGFMFEFSGYSASVLHLLRAYGLGLLLILFLVSTLIFAQTKTVFIIVALCLFTLNRSFTENIIRLGPVEPYQVIFLALFSILFLKKRYFIEKGFHKGLLNILIFLTLTSLILTKETSFVILLPILFINQFVSKDEEKTKTIYLLLPVLIFFAGRAAAFKASEIYTLDYNLDVSAMLRNLVLYLGILSSILGKFLIISGASLIPFVLISKLRKTLLDKQFIYWILVSLAYLAILLPWKYVMDRYLLPVIFGLINVVFILLSRLTDFLKGELGKQNFVTRRNYYFYSALLIILISNIYFDAFTPNYARSQNYRNWYAMFNKFEGEQIATLLRFPDKDIYINAKDILYNYEVFYELPIHFQYIYHQSPRMGRFTGVEHGYVLTRSYLEPAFTAEELDQLGYKEVASKRYSAEQINEGFFRNEFVANALVAISSPPLGKPEEFFWEIRKK